MSEELKQTLEIAEDVTPEQILNQLFKMRKVPFSTELDNPTAITALELLAKEFKNYKGIGDLLDLWIKKFKVNMIANKRKRATEITNAYSARREELDRKKQAQELLLGK